MAIHYLHGAVCGSAEFKMIPGNAQITETVRPRPALFRALGNQDPPAELIIGGRKCRRVDIFKHDSWAATARYQGEGVDVVCKFNRRQSILGVPMGWLGRGFARREARAMRTLAGVPGIPVDCGPVSVDGRILANAVGHDFIAGRPLGFEQQPNDDFFSRLLDILAAVHARNLAYVDLHKRENVIVASDGSPYLIDFQVYFGLLRPLWARNWFCRQMLAGLQRLDYYNVGKHIIKHRLDQFDALSRRFDPRRPWWIQVHRCVAVPFRTCRRKLLSIIKVRAAGGQASSELFAEDALRLP